MRAYIAQLRALEIIRSIPYSVIVLGMLFLGGFSMPLAAQTDSVAESEYDNENILEEILVTATKRGLINAQDLNLAITAFDSQKLEKLNAVDFDELMVQVPSTNFISNGGPGRGHEVASIRGLSRVSDSTIPVVATYLDGSPRYGANYRMYDVGTVFVLRGPQGTLWGNQSLGGVISFNSNRPDLTDMRAMAQSDIYSSDGDGGMSYRLNGMFNMPIMTDKLALRVAVQTIDETGYVDNITTGVDDINDVEETSWRASLLWQPTDSASVTMVYHDNDLHADAPTFFSLDYPGYISERPSEVNPVDEDWNLFNLIVDIGFDWADFNYTGSWYDLTRVMASNDIWYTGEASLNASKSTPESVTHELRFADTSEGRLGWVAGVYYDDFDALDQAITINADTDEIIAQTGGPRNTKDKAIFGELTYDVTDKFQALIGARYYDWEVTETPYVYYRDFGGDLSGEGGTVGDTGSLFKIQGSYQQNDNASWYGLISQGFRIGGFNPGLGGTTGWDPDKYARYDPDELTNYEVGYKSVWKDNQVFFNAAAYFMEWDNVISVVANETGSYWINANVPDLEAWGVEFETGMRDLFWEGFFASMTYSYQKNEFQSSALLFPGSPTNILKGDELRRTPRNSWSFNLSYDWTIGSSVDAYVRGNYWHKDKTNSNGFNKYDGDIDIPAQDVINMSAGFYYKGWDTKFYVNNVADERPLLQVFAAERGSSLATEASSVRPRTFGLILTYRWN